MTTAIVLAAGKGTRMRSDLPKVAHRAMGRTLVGWVLAALEPLHLDATVVVVGHGADEVRAVLPDEVTAAVQEPQRGTADAVEVGLAAAAPTERVLVIPGDMPLLTTATLEGLLAAHADAEAAATMLTAVLDDPTGYGRVVRDDAGRVLAVVEERDADAATRAIREMNTSVYVFDTAALAAVLPRIGDANHQGERYLTDAVGLLVADGATIATLTTDPEEAEGVNTHVQLAHVAAVLRRRINRRLMEAGVAMVDPDRIHVEADVAVAPGATLWPNVYLRGATEIAAGAEVGPDVDALDTTIAEGARVRNAVLDGAVVGPRATVGPYAYLRPGAVLEEGAKAGCHVEIKNSVVGRGSKVPHLAYVGDATIGEDSNLGAGTVTVNYDGYEKHRTIIGDRVRIGSDTMLVAPVEIGDEAYTGAGSVITRDVPPGTLAVERSPQTHVEGYAERRKRRAQEKRG